VKLTHFFMIVAIALFTLPLQAAEHGAKLVDDAFTKAFISNDLDAIVALYAPNAVMYPPDASQARGKDEIRAGYAALLQANTIKEFQALDSTYESYGDISIGWGRWTITMVPKSGGDPIHMEGRFTDVAKRIDGKWFYIVDHASVPLPPMTGTQTAPSSGK
jgi:uncharacterized protein (TIGR02246 family)